MIVQEYGPIYGEPVNGTVMGRPNGSVYVPPFNTISVSIPEDYRYLKYYTATALQSCTSDGGVVPSSAIPLYVAQAQDISSNMRIEVYSDAELTTLVAYRDLPAGIFNHDYGNIWYADSGLTDGQTVYLRGVLMNNGTQVAASDPIEMTMVVPS